MKKDMRVAVTKRMLREGFLRCLEAKPISRITVSDLCRESGVNRATFYNHYESPAMILKEIAYEYGQKLSEIYISRRNRRDKDDAAALEGCLDYVLERKTELKVLFSGHAEPYLAGVVMEIINEKVALNASSTGAYDRHDEYLLQAVASAAAAYGFIQVWLTMDIDKTPKELVGIMKKVIQGDVFLLM